MKCKKILLTIPAIVSSIVPAVTMAGCSCKKNSISIDLISDKTIYTDVGSTYGFFQFQLNKSVNKNDIVPTVVVTGGTYQKTLSVSSMEVSEDNKLTVAITFDDQDINGGDNAIFDLNLNINSKDYKFESLEIVYVALVNPLPERALDIDEDTLTLNGLVSGFDTAHYDTLEVPSRIKNIKVDAFKDKFTSTTNSNIITISLNANLETVGDGAFSGCNAISTLDVSEVIAPEQNSADTIKFGTGVFENWASFGTIYYGAGITYNNLLDCKMYDSLLSIDWFDDEATRPILVDDLEIAGTTLTRFKEDTLPKHVTELCNTLEIPSTVTLVGECAFYDVTSETSLLPSNIKKLTYADDCQLTTIGSQAFAKSSFTGIIDIPATLETINSSAFKGSTKITGINFDESQIKNILDSAFEGCSSITELWLPKTLIKLGTKAFANCSNLQSIDVTSFGPESLPEGWNNTDVFANLAPRGAVWCHVINAENKKTYFSEHGIDFSATGWVISDYATLTTDDYESYYAADPQQVENIVDFYRQQIANNKSFFIEDIYHSLYKWSRKEDSNECVFSELYAKVTGFTMKVDNTISFDILMKFKVTSDEEEYSVASWHFDNFTLDNMVGTKQSGYWEFKDSTLAEQADWTLIVTEDSYIELTDPVRIYKANLSEIDLTDENTVGYTLSKFNAFSKIATPLSFSWYFHSYYLKDVTVTE